jgi:hypothetical protein
VAVKSACFGSTRFCFCKAKAGADYLLLEARSKNTMRNREGMKKGYQAGASFQPFLFHKFLGMDTIGSDGAICKEILPLRGAGGVFTPADIPPRA